MTFVVPDGYMTMTDVSKRLDIAYDQVRQLAEDGILSSRKQGPFVLATVASVIEEARRLGVPEGDIMGFAADHYYPPRPRPKTVPVSRHRVQWRGTQAKRCPRHGHVLIRGWCVVCGDVND